jgi:O-methyltransferase involved in polyketide biosynthesis
VVFGTVCNGRVADKQGVQLGGAQETLFIPLAARARQAGKKRPLLRDPRAQELVAAIDYDTDKYDRGVGGWVTVLRTAIYDYWLRAFLAEHPRGTVVELGTGLNTRFERVDNGELHWIDLDLPDTIELRRRFFTDTDRREMVVASVTDPGWLDTVAQRPGPYFFVADGVLVYLPEDEVSAVLLRIGERFPGALIALDTYNRKTYERQHQLATRRGIAGRWAWACDEPRALERLGLRVVESVPITRPPRGLRRELPARYRVLLPLADPALRGVMRMTLFRADPG